MTKGLHVHIHRTRIRTSSSLEHANKQTNKREKTDTLGFYFSTSCCRAVFALGSNCWLYLQTDGQVHPGAKGGADCSGRQAHVLEELREGVCEGEAGPLLCYHHAASNTRQVHSTGLQMHPHRFLVKRSHWLHCTCFDQLLIIVSRKTLKTLRRSYANI